MAAELFVDTGAWIALADKRDEHHADAAGAYSGLLRTYARLVTTNLVVAETYSLLRTELGHRPAVRFLDSIAASPRIERVPVTEEMEDEAEDFLRECNDQAFSYVDAISLAVMRARGIHEVFAFNGLFNSAGFKRIP